MNIGLILELVGKLTKVGFKLWNKKARKDAKEIITGIGSLDADAMRKLLKRV